MCFEFFGSRGNPENHPATFSHKSPLGSPKCLACRYARSSTSTSLHQASTLQHSSCRCQEAELSSLFLQAKCRWTWWYDESWFLFNQPFTSLPFLRRIQGHKFESRKSVGLKSEFSQKDRAKFDWTEGPKGYRLQDTNALDSFRKRKIARPETNVGARLVYLHGVQDMAMCQNMVPDGWVFIPANGRWVGMFPHGHFF